MSRKVLLFLAAVAFVSCSFAATVHAADSAIKSVSAILKTEELGQIVIGARIEYQAEVKASDIKFDKTYLVYGFPVIGTYVNNDGVYGNAQPSGKYVFLQFGVEQVPANMTKRTFMYDGVKTHKQDVHIGIRQMVILTLSDGTKVPLSGMTNDKGKDISLEIDDFKKVAFTDSTGHTIYYRLFIPKGYETKKADLKNLPIVIFLHGAGEYGPGDDVQLIANPSALEFAKPEAQAKHPCFVLAPQATRRTPNGGMWADYPDKERSSTIMSQDLKAAIEALRGIMNTYNVDAKRVYGTGLSAGSRGTIAASIFNHDLYAAQLQIASSDVYSDDEIRHMAKMPIWFVLSADESEERLTKMPATAKQLEKLGGKVNWKIGKDAMNGFARGFEAAKQAQAQIDEAKANGQNILFTHLVAGTVIEDPHRSWVWTYNNEAIRDWLFAQSK